MSLASAKESGATSSDLSRRRSPFELLASDWPVEPGGFHCCAHQRHHPTGYRDGSPKSRSLMKPTSSRMNTVAIATSRRSVRLSAHGAARWTQIAREGSSGASLQICNQGKDWETWEIVMGPMTQEECLNAGSHGDGWGL